MISVRGLTKDYRGVRAVDDVSFDVEPGIVTGFLGPNGAGKSTTMRLVLGIDRPTCGVALVNGRSYARMGAPLYHVGAMLDAGAMHPGRTGRAHLRIAARTHAIAGVRVEEVIEQVGLRESAGRRIKGYSLGMRQRLGIAAAILAKPEVLIFDEPMNGLDLDGVRWIRALLRGLADQGRTVFVSSHLMSEMQTITDRLIVIARGRLVADVTIEEMLRGAGGARVRVQTPAADELARALSGSATLERVGPEELDVEGLTAAEVGDRARALGVAVHSLGNVDRSLEDAYLRLTEHDVEVQGTTKERRA
ncbi:MAG: ATP-binding cassette domain-containing protein [Nocardioides sp.]